MKLECIEINSLTYVCGQKLIPIRNSKWEMAQVIEWKEQVGTIKGVNVGSGCVHISFYTKSQIYLLFMVGFLDPVSICGGGVFPYPQTILRNFRMLGVLKVNPVLTVSTQR